MKNQNIMIRRETPDEYAAVENLTREAFWNVYRPGCLEHYVLHVLRADPAFIPELDLVMEYNGQLIGHIMYMHAAIETDSGTRLPVCTFGPISIHPDFQRQGYGKRLLDFSMEKARALGIGALCIEGNIDFYGKSGFVLASSQGIRYHGAPDDEMLPYFLVKELKQGFLSHVSGVYHTPQGYYVSETDAEAFDQTFPPKEKQVLPGQIFSSAE